MLILITYDISTESTGGRKRLSKIAKECTNYGQRVQDSVFECILDYSQALMLKKKLVSIMDPSVDSLRFYYLGNKYDNKIEHFGAKSTYDADGSLIV